MLIEILLLPVIWLVDWGFSLINKLDISLPSWLGDTLSLISKALMFFPTDVYVVVIANIVFWLTLQLTWGIIEWIYKKIPGIN